MIQLYPDQQESVEKLRNSLRRHKSVLLQGETGSGKSVMAAYMLAGARAKGLKTAFVVPRIDLLNQMSGTFAEFDLPHSFVAAGRPFNPYSSTWICSAMTLVNRMSSIEPDMIIFDECHFGGEGMEKLINHYRARGAWVIGLSATPEKTDGRGLDAYYDDLVVGKGIRELIDLKRLSDYRLFAPSAPDLSGIKTVAGDYAKGELASFMENERVLIGDAVKHYKSHADGLLNVTFCTSIKHSQITAQAFNDAGVPSVHMDGETPEIERKRMAAAFARREIMNICSVDLLCFGYDLASASGVKGATIESMSDLRPTKSRPLQRQKNGRVLRYKDRPAIILDHAGNAAFHGMPCQSVDWSLKGRERKTRDGGERTVAVKQCGVCFYVSAPSPVCPNCGHIHPIDSREVEQKDGELVEVDPRVAVVARKKEQGRAQTYDELVAIGIARGMKNPRGWALHVYNARKAKG